MSDSDKLLEEDLSCDEPSVKKLKEDVSVVFCDVCRPESTFISASYLCYDCEQYFCSLCFQNHDNHSYIRDNKFPTDEEKVRRVNYLDELRGNRVNNQALQGENSDTYNWQRRVIKHERDRIECDISGLCVYDNTRLVLVDYYNDCLKILSLETFIIDRYIRFPQDPRDVTEIKEDSAISRQSIQPGENTDCLNLSQRSTPDQTLVQPTDHQTEKAINPDVLHSRQAEHLLAVTIPYRKQIWLININNRPAYKQKTIDIADGCLRIKYCSGKIFALCRGEDTVYSIHILSKSGLTINILKPEQNYIKNFDVLDDKVYVTDYTTDRVVSINVENGNTISSLEIKGSGTDGICHDKHKNVYIAAGKGYIIYKTHEGLDRYEPMNLNSDFIDSPRCIIFHDNKLFLTHSRQSVLGNFLTVIKL